MGHMMLKNLRNDQSDSGSQFGVDMPQRIQNLTLNDEL